MWRRATAKRHHWSEWRWQFVPGDRVRVGQGEPTMTATIEGIRGGDDGGERARGGASEDGMRAMATAVEEETMAGEMVGQATVSFVREDERGEARVRARRGGCRQEREEEAAASAMCGDRERR